MLLKPSLELEKLPFPIAIWVVAGHLLIDHRADGPNFGRVRKHAGRPETAGHQQCHNDECCKKLQRELFPAD